MGLKNGVAPAILQIQSLLDEGTTVRKHELYNTSAMECTTIAFTALYDSYVLKVLNMDDYILLNVSLSTCPLGFEVSAKTKACDCEEALKQSVSNISCDAATSTISRKRGIWIGNISDCVIRSSTTATQHRSASLSLILIPSVLSTGLEYCVEGVRMGSVLLWDLTTVFNVLNSRTLL